MNPPLWSAVAFLLVRTAVNRVRALVRRLRQPRYLVGILAFGGYLALTLSPLRSLGIRSGGELALVGLTAFPIASAWVFGGDDAVLAFTEAEIQHLFPGPVTRRQLLMYKIVRGAVGAVPYALFVTVVFGTRFTSHWAYCFVGLWLGFLIIDLHAAGASSVRAILADNGVAGVRRRVGTFVVLAAAAGALGWVATRVTPPPQTGVMDQLAWASHVIGEPPLSVALAPIRAHVRVALAGDLVAFALALPGALLVLGAHVLWVLSSGPFEDGTVAAAARRAAVREGRSGFGVLRLPAVRIPLAATGTPWVAIAWKGLIASVRTAPLRLAVVLGSVSIGFAIAAMTVTHRSGVAASVVALSLALYLAVLGATLLRVDLRQDIAMLDVLRAMPLSGRQIVLGELLGPIGILVAAEWACLAVAVLLAWGWPRVPGPERIGLALGLGILLPVATLVGLVVQNATVVLFPVIEAPGGFDAAGRRLLTLFTNVAVLLGAGVPTAIACAALWAARPWIGPLVWPIGAALGVVPVLGLIWAAVGWMGRGLDALDPTDL